MTDEKTTGKVKDGSKADPKSVPELIKLLTKLGAGGTAALASVILGAVVWLKSEITDTVREVVRAEIQPLEERVRELEIEQEVRRRTNDRKE